MFIAALFTMAKRWEQPKCPSTDGWINKMQYIYTVEYHASVKSNNVPIQATTWTNPENMLTERNHTQKATHMIPFMTYPE